MIASDQKRLVVDDTFRPLSRKERAAFLQRRLDTGRQSPAHDASEPVTPRVLGKVTLIQLVRDERER